MAWIPLQRACNNEFGVFVPKELSVKKLIYSLVAAAALIFSGAAVAAAELGKDYTLMNPPQPTSTKKIEVLEFFFYECGHCYHLHPLLAACEKKMPKDVEIVYVPTMFRDSTE